MINPRPWRRSRSRSRSGSKKKKMAPTLKTTLLFLSILVSLAQSLDGDDDKCVYVVYIRTGSIFKGGTDSIISLTLNDAFGKKTFRIPNLETWGGLMGPDHDYFERGNLDIFSGRGPCFDATVCAMNLTSDGSGPHHGWYCNYVEVTTTGPHVPCTQQLFTVEQWIARDAPPYQLTAIRDSCARSNRLHTTMESSPTPRKNAYSI